MSNKLVFPAFIFIIGFAMVGAAALIAEQNLPKSHEKGLMHFSSEQELKDFIDLSQYSYTSYLQSSQRSFSATSVMTSSTGSEASDYSKTNVQVSDVDEADITKNDGKHIYTISGNKVIIADAYPAENARIVSKIQMESSPTKLFINKDKLIIFTQDYPVYQAGRRKPIMAMPTRISDIVTGIQIYDVSDKGNPKLTRNLTVTGNLQDARMIGDYVYAIANQLINYYGEGPVPMPRIWQNGIESDMTAMDVYYFENNSDAHGYINVVSVNTQDDSANYTSKTFLGSSQNIYMSQDNLYITYTQWSNVYTPMRMLNEIIVPLLPKDIAKKLDDVNKGNGNVKNKMEQSMKIAEDYFKTVSDEEKQRLERDLSAKATEFNIRMTPEEKTIVQKLSINNGNVKYEGLGTVPGHLLNQFSMDEYNGNFRLATTIGQAWDRQQPSQNNVYVLDENLQIAGKVENLAPGETIYSARFMGNKAYVVTFEKVDPLFVIDLNDPANPQVLGKLKIPGYSDYLQPYDENHLIGIGKDAVEAENGGFTWYQGLKLALFDVTDPENPKEISKYAIGDRGTDSYALQNHKAVLFGKEKNLLVIPVLLAEIDRSRYAGKLPANAYGDYTWQGAYVFSLSPESGFELKGRVTHLDDGQDLLKSGYYFGSTSSIKRSLYMDDVLYTVSDSTIKANRMPGLEEIKRLDLDWNRND